jgi:hypothetical protein
MRAIARAFAVGDQRRERRRPPVEFGRDAGGRGGGVGEVDAGDPLGRAVQLDVRVQDVPRLAVGDDPPVAAVAEGPDAADLASPPDHVVGQRVEQDATQVPAQHLGTPGGAFVGLVEQRRALRVERAQRLAALVDDRAELAGEVGRGERALPVVGVNVELTALRADVFRGVGLVDRRGDAVEDAGEGEAAEARADDRDWRCHRHCPFP